ncbi:hypothetical protein DY000_02043510 [Brassica cretica]|uniref:Uncharacterized protein n=1 Tax=Brassica cretica TaxID=69181 RepID=A0ABQ7B8C9_BRACR|nr:hypothetical protein DY000_02043510 [Brassica cretica]
MFVVLWLGLHRGSGGSGPWNRSEVRSFRGFEVSRSGVGVEAWVWGPDLGVEVEYVSLLRPSSSFSARACSSDLSVGYHGGSSGEVIVSGRAVQIHFGFSDVEARETKDLWLCHRGSSFCGGMFGSSQLQGLDLGHALDCSLWSGAGCVRLFSFRCGGVALLGESSSSIKTRHWLACMLDLGVYYLIVLAAA